MYYDELNQSFDRPAAELQTVSLNDIQSKPVNWLWYPYIPLGKITILQGDPGEGKTTLALNLAAMLSRGEIFGDPKHHMHADILYQTAEDGISDTIKPRLEAAGASMRSIFSIIEGDTPLSVFDPRLDQAMAQIMPSLLILDPIQAYLGADTDMHRANEIRPIMHRLADLAERWECAVLLIGHMNKKMGDKAIYRGLGSIDLAAAARSILLMVRDNADPDVRVMVQIKNSLAKEGAPLAFRVGENSRMSYEGVYQRDISALMLADTAGRPAKTELAKHFLREQLANGTKPSSEVIAAAHAEGISESILANARKALNVSSERRNGKWYLTLPDDARI